MAKRIHQQAGLFGNAYLLSITPDEVLSVLNDTDGMSKWVHAKVPLIWARRAIQANLRGESLKKQIEATSHTQEQYAKAVEDYTAAGKMIQTEFSKIAQLWIQCGKDLTSPEAALLYGNVDSFLKNHPPALYPFKLRPSSIPCFLCFSQGNVQTIEDESQRQLGWLCLSLVASAWSMDLFQCSKCSKFFIRKRDNNAGSESSQTKYCSRKCRSSFMPQKKSDELEEKREYEREQKIKAACGVIVELNQLPKESFPHPCEDFVARKVSQRLNLKKPITRWFITRWLEKGRIPLPLAVQQTSEVQKG